MITVVRINKLIIIENKIRFRNSIFMLFKSLIIGKGSPCGTGTAKNLHKGSYPCVIS